MRYHRQHQLRDQLRRRGPPLVAAIVLWLAWTLISLTLYRVEHGLLLALLLLGLLVLLGGAYGLLWVRRELRRERQREAKQQQELAWLSAEIRPRRPLPLFVGGMAKPDLLIATWQLIRQERPQRVLELGSGLSTLVMAYALQANGQGELVALENIGAYAAHNRRLLAEHNLSERAHVLDAPLRHWELKGRSHQWYALTNLSFEFPFNLLLVDGPAGYLAPMIRYPALPLLHKHLAEHALILFDDTNRSDEHHIAQRWLAEIPGLQRDERFADSEFIIFRFTRPETNPN